MHDVFPALPAMLLPPGRYAWGRDTLPLEYPKGVGYAMGAGTRIRHAVLKVHYTAGARPDRDNTGVRLK
jgi:hypothetical protein